MFEVIERESGHPGLAIFAQGSLAGRLDRSQGPALAFGGRRARRHRVFTAFRVGVEILEWVPSRKA